MFKQMFGKNPGRMVEETETEDPRTGRTLAFFYAYTLHGDRWLENSAWKPKSIDEAQAWLDTKGQQH